MKRKVGGETSLASFDMSRARCEEEGEGEMAGRRRRLLPPPPLPRGTMGEERKGGASEGGKGGEKCWLAEGGGGDASAFLFPPLHSLACNGCRIQKVLSSSSSRIEARESLPRRSSREFLHFEANRVNSCGARRRWRHFSAQLSKSFSELLLSGSLPPKKSFIKVADRCCQEICTISCSLVYTSRRYETGSIFLPT